MSSTILTRPSSVGPQRTCIASRRTQSLDQLLRCVVVRDEKGTAHVLPDPKRRQPGRGAWITATVEAYETAVQRRAFARALKVSAEADTQSVREYIVAVTAKETDY